MDYGNKYEDFKKWCINLREDLFDIMGTEFGRSSRFTK